ncbi:FtsP/CotA-like multicopper oxidase with cupredoxin domain [Streptacidiphilus sp. MAP12-20]|uniref:multicopper oxidase family protein n=1 Tax=Streptacidiphilus sp. MAP12-20 TaxID=3156299 RepID=UPI003517D5BE
MNKHTPVPQPTRRTVLLAGTAVAGAGLLAACTKSSRTPGKGDSSTTGSGAELVSPSGPQVAAADAKRTRTGRTTTVALTATAGTVDLGGPMVKTWTFGGQLPGREIRFTAGDALEAKVANHLPAPTAVHWHGLALRNDMDGVAPITQRAIAAGGSFTYRFTLDTPGTYWFHPHVGVQLDRGLYAPLIVEDPHEPLAYDSEWVVVLDDWLDGTGTTPDDVKAMLTMGMSSPAASASPSASDSMGGMASMPGMDMSSSASAGASSTAMPGMSGMPGMGGGAASSYMLMGATSTLLGGDAGDVKYPYYLVNGRVPAAPEVFTSKPGKKIRLRLINAGGDTAFRVALGGHRLIVTHTDGFPVQHQQVDALLIGPGERYDVLVTLGDGVFPLAALAEGKGAAGRALVRTGWGSAPAVGVRPKELDGMLMTGAQLRAADSVRLASKTVDRTHRLELTGSMSSYNWAINGRRFDMNQPTANPFLAREGQRIRLEFVNKTTMWHPMHLHGHTFQLGADGPRKDTAIVLPGRTVACDFDADNPGQWLIHCHNVYHGEAGMMGLLGYTT